MSRIQCKIQGKMGQLRSSNQGFTFVELLTALTIFAFFSISLLMYMQSAATINSNVAKSVNLSTQSQVALGLVEEFLIDCSGVIHFDDTDNILYVINDAGSSAVAHVFEFDAANYALYYLTATIQKDELRGYLVYEDSGGTLYEKEADTLLAYSYTVPINALQDSHKELVSYNITDFHVEIISGDELAISRFYSVHKAEKVKVTFEMCLNPGSPTADVFTGVSDIGMRNYPIVSVGTNCKDEYHIVSTFRDDVLGTSVAEDIGKLKGDLTIHG